MPRPGLVVLGWVAATAAAVGIAYAGVSTVAGGVVDPLPPTTALPTSPPTEPATDGATAPVTEPATDEVTDGATAPVTEPAPGEVRSYALVGGSATLRYAPGEVRVVTAEPRQGFRLEVEGDGSAEVRVEFESDDHRSRLRGTWEGAPVERIEEDDDRGDDDRDDD